MSKCLRITLTIDVEENLLHDFIQKNAKKFNLEGTVQAIDEKTIKVYVCGQNDKVDDFLDALYKGYKNSKPSSLEIEPFLKDRDYRGVFRVIE